MYSFRGRGTANKTGGTGSRKLPMYSNREHVTTRVLACLRPDTHHSGSSLSQFHRKKPKTTKLVRIKHPWLSEQTLREMFLMLKSETLNLSLQAGFNLIGERKTKFLSLMLPDKQTSWVPGTVFLSISLGNLLVTIYNLPVTGQNLRASLLDTVHQSLL